MPSSLSKDDEITFRRLLNRSPELLAVQDKAYLLGLLPSLDFDDVHALRRPDRQLGESKRFVDALERAWPRAESEGRQNACIVETARLFDEHEYAELVGRLAPALLEGGETQQRLALVLFHYLRGSARYERIARNLRIRPWFPEVGTLPLRFMGERTDGDTLLRRLVEYARRSADHASAIWDLASETEDHELEDSVAPVGLEFLASPATKAVVAAQLCQWVAHWLHRDEAMRDARVAVVYEHCEQARVEGRTWEEIDAGWVAGVPEVRARLVERALDDGVVLFGAASRVLPRLVEGRSDAWEHVFQFRREDRPLPDNLRTRMLREGVVPASADQAFFHEYRELWRWMSAGSPVTLQELVLKILDATPTLTSARAFFEELMALEVNRRREVLASPRVASVAALVDAAHDAIPSIQDFRFDNVGLANFHAFHRACAAAEMREQLLGTPWRFAPDLEGPAVRLALEADDGTCRRAIVARLCELPFRDYVRLQRRFPHWIPEEALLERAKSDPEALERDVLARLSDGDLIDRVEKGPDEELLAVVERFPEGHPERHRLFETLVRRLNASLESRVALAVGRLLDSRNAWAKRAAPILLELARVGRLDLVEVVLGGAPVQPDPPVDERDRATWRKFVAAMHGALATALFDRCRDLAGERQLEEAARLVDAVALLDPPPPVVQHIWRLAKDLEAHERIRDRLTLLRRLYEKEGGTEAIPGALFDCLNAARGRRHV